MNSGQEPKTEQEWQRQLNQEQYRVLRQKGTELPFSGKYYYNKEKGVYCCAGCGNPLFNSERKYESGTGWPSFTAPLADDSVGFEIDRSHGMNRTEVLCRRCGGHLGHVFPDGPRPSGQRYCINSAALQFHPASEPQSEPAPDKEE